MCTMSNLCHALGLSSVFCRQPRQNTAASGEHEHESQYHFPNCETQKSTVPPDDVALKAIAFRHTRTQIRFVCVFKNTNTTHTRPHIEMKGENIFRSISMHNNSSVRDELESRVIFSVVCALAAVAMFNLQTHSSEKCSFLFGFIVVAVVLGWCLFYVSLFWIWCFACRRSTIVLEECFVCAVCVRFGALHTAHHFNFNRI